MRVFADAPFNLGENDVIKARTYATKGLDAQGNDQRSSDVSNCADADMQSLPKRVTLPAAASVQTKKAIQFEWEDVCRNVQGCHYEVVFSYEGGREQREITNSYQFRILAPIQGVDYTFTVETCNECGKSQKSNPLVVNICDTPEVPTCIISEPSACGIKVDWLAPSNTPGSLIDYYEIALSTKDN